ncbi:MAG: transcription elongation factor GreA [Fimbriimonadaceae bacterium]|jgi:transcription elongation factor GreA|nr:transcription elongation factor GreA [Fimbriimonadaceae bacterium]
MSATNGAIIAGLQAQETNKNMNEPDILAEQTGGFYLTPEGHATLQHELDHLTTTKRPEIADRIRESQTHGEFAEDNSELDEVKFEQAMVEGRIAELKTIFGNAHVIDMKTVPTDYVGLGSLVSVQDLDYGDDFVIRVVTSVEADPTKDLVSNESPLGMAMQGHKKGETIKVDAPEGVKTYKITKIAR